MNTKPPRIGFDLQADGRVVVAPIDFTGNKFTTYRDLCGNHGARYDGELKASLMLPDLVPGLAAALKTEGMIPVVSEKLAALLRARAGEATAEVEAAKIRLADLIAHLKEKGLELYPFQVSGVAWLETRASALLCDEPGLGKTVQGIMFLRREKTRAIIVCPASLKGNWAKEFARWRPDLMTIILTGKRSFCWPQPGQVVIINPDILPRVEEEGEDGTHKLKPFADCPEGIDLIADECHAYKSSKTHRTRSFRSLGRAVRKAGGRTVGMSGTPILNRPEELHALLVAFDLLKETFGDWMTFNKTFGAVEQRWGGRKYGDPKAAIGPILKRVMLRRTRLEVLPDLPTKTREIADVEIDRETQSLSDQARAAMLAAGIDLEKAIEEGGKFGAAFEAISKTRSALAKAKIPSMLEHLDRYEEEGQAVVVFSVHKAPVQALEGRAGWRTFTGETPAAERTAIVQDLQDGKLKGIACTIGAGGVGHTMTFAHNALFVDLDWTPALNCQAEDRICRIGQDRGCIIRILEAPDTIDQDVNEILLRKQKLIDGSIEKATSKAAEVPVAVRPEELQAAAENVGTITKWTGGRRKAAGPKEEWAKDGVIRITQRGAWKPEDSGFGGSLGAQLQRAGELSDKQWKWATILAKKYPAEAGNCPG